MIWTGNWDSYFCMSILSYSTYAHIPRSHVQWPGLLLVAGWTNIIPDGSTTQLK